MDIFTAGNSLIILLIGIFSVTFFFVGVSKLYESILGILLGILVYFGIFTIAYYAISYPEIDFFGKGIFINWEDFLKKMSIYLTVILGIAAPIENSLHVSNQERAPLTRALKSVVISTFYVLFVLAIMSFFIYKSYPFDVDTLFTQIQDWSVWRNFVAGSSLFNFAYNNSIILLLLAILLIIYKVLISQYADKIATLCVAAWLAMKDKMMDNLGVRSGEEQEEPEDEH